MLPNRLDIKRYSVDQAQQKAKICQPTMQDVQTLVANSSQQCNEVGLHAQSHNPWHHSHGNHTGTDCQWWRSVAYALPVQRLWYEAVEYCKDQGWYNDEENTKRRQYNRTPFLRQTDVR